MSPRYGPRIMVRRFRLMTANLLNGKADPGNLGEVLDRVRPDVIVTQEMGPNAAEVIASRYPHHDLHPDLIGQGRGIASRFDAEFSPLVLPWRSGSWARVEIGLQPIIVADVHMPNPIIFPWWVSVPGRTDQLDALFAWADRTIGGEAVVVAGDMNATPRWPLYRRLAERWEDLAVTAALSSGTSPAPTWGLRPSWPRILRIDHVLGSGMRAVGTAVERLQGTDHSALVVDMELHW